MRDSQPQGKSNNRLYYLTGHIRQAVIAALELVGETLVIDAQAVENCCLQVKNMDGIAADVITEIIGLLVRHAGLDAAADLPHCETTAMMIAPVFSGC